MIHVIWNEKEAEAIWRQGRDVYTPYLFEILKQAGLAYQVWTPQSWLDSRPEGVTLVAGLDHRKEWPSAFSAYCDQGNAVLAVGGTHGLDHVLGVRSVRMVKEGWIGWGGSPYGEGLLSSFHFFGAALVVPQDGIEPHGTLELHNGAASNHPAVSFNGTASLLAVDLARTFCMIQQGVSVHKDGVLSEDGTGLINDDIFKADDSVVLDWKKDRDSFEGGAPFYLHPIVDEYRVMLLRLLHELHRRISRPMAQVWFWPEGVEAVGHISHDTDGNAVDAAEMMLDRLKEADIHSSWCVIMPGYPDHVYRRIIEDGHEIALHYNALETEQCYWDERLFNEQLSMLQGQMANLEHGEPVRTNKNHYLRWEGDVQFYQWCERAGIVVEQSKGGTKQGNKGFLSGTCHMHLPISNAAERNRLMKVYSNPTLAWDPPMALRCTGPEARAIIDRCKSVYGVAHFLYHPATFKLHAEVGPTFVETVRYGKEQGLPWWTAKQLYEWHELRRTIEVQAEAGKLVVKAGGACQGLTVLLPADHPLPEGGAGGTVRAVKPTERYGMPLQMWVLDVPQGETVIPLAKGAAAVS